MARGGGGAVGDADLVPLFDRSQNDVVDGSSSFKNPVNFFSSMFPCSTRKREK